MFLPSLTSKGNKDALSFFFHGTTCKHSTQCFLCFTKRVGEMEKGKCIPVGEIKRSHLVRGDEGDRASILAHLPSSLLSISLSLSVSLTPPFIYAVTCEPATVPFFFVLVVIIPNNWVGALFQKKLGRCWSVGEG